MSDTYPLSRRVRSSILVIAAAAGIAAGSTAYLAQDLWVAIAAAGSLWLMLMAFLWNAETLLDKDRYLEAFVSIWANTKPALAVSASAFAYTLTIWKFGFDEGRTWVIVSLPVAPFLVLLAVLAVDRRNQKKSGSDKNWG